MKLKKTSSTKLFSTSFQAGALSVALWAILAATSVHAGEDSASIPTPAPTLADDCPEPTPTDIPVGTTPPVIARLSYYGYKNDSQTDSNTAAKWGAGGLTLQDGDLALSKTLEDRVVAQGGKLGCQIEVTLSDGTKIVGRFADRVPATCKKKGKTVNLPTSVDKYVPNLTAATIPTVNGSVTDVKVVAPQSRRDRIFTRTKGQDARHPAGTKQ